MRQAISSLARTGEPSRLGPVLLFAAFAALLAACASGDAPAPANHCGRPCTNCPDERLVFPGEVPSVARIRADGERFYLQTASQDAEGHTYGVYSVSRVGGGSTMLHSSFARHTDSIEAPPPGFDLVGSSLYVYGDGEVRLAVDGSETVALPALFVPRVVFLDDGIIALARSLGEATTYAIVQLSLDGAPRATLYPGLSDVFSLARGGDALFWEQLAEDKKTIVLFRGGLDGRPPQQIATGLSPLGGYSDNSIAADDKFIYYFRDYGDLYRANHEGGNAVRLTSGPTTVRGLGDGCTLVTATGLDRGTYFASDEGGPLVRVSPRVGSSWADADHVYVAEGGDAFVAPRH